MFLEIRKQSREYYACGSGTQMTTLEGNVDKSRFYVLAISFVEFAKFSALFKHVFIYFLSWLYGDRQTITFGDKWGLRFTMMSLQKVQETYIHVTSSKEW